MSEEQQASFSGWARVEVMGHQTHIGFVKTEAFGQAVMFRVDTPELPEREYVLTEPETALIEGVIRWCPVGTKVKRPATPGTTVLIGSGSIYRLIPCTEAVALKAIEQTGRRPLQLIELAANAALQAPADFDNGLEDDDDDDDPDQDGPGSVERFS